MYATHNSANFFGDPDGPKFMHLANGDRIRALAKGLDMQQNHIVRMTGLSQRTVRHMMTFERPVKLWEIGLVARALGVTLDQIKGIPAEDIAPGHGWEIFPIGLRDRRIMCKVLDFDMNSQFGAALDLLSVGIAQLDPRNPTHLKDWAFYCMKRDSIRSNAGDNHGALIGVDGLLEVVGDRLQPNCNLLGLIHFHRAVILRRVKRRDEAAALFGELMHKWRICEPGSLHQLGVLAFLEAGSDANSPLLTSAQQLLKRSQAEWSKGAGSYRAGFSELRLGEVRMARGDRVGAARYFNSALSRFEGDDCTRYVIATRNAIDDL